jgi:hypothetical protein
MKNQLTVLIYYGQIGHLDNIKNFSQLWSLAPYPSSTLIAHSGLSDIAEFNNICRMTVNDKNLKKFKSKRKYREILQPVTKQQRRDCIYELNEDPGNYVNSI